MTHGGDTLVADPPPGPGRHAKSGMTPGDWVRFVLRGVGQTLITAGLVVLLFVVYEVYITNIFSHRDQTRVHNALEDAWANGKDPLLGLPGGKSATIPLGTGIANLYIPRLGKDYAWTIVEGAGDASLEKGPGHYQGTALPGQIGNFAVAGHRVGKGEPFLNLDKMRAGDYIIVETKTQWLVYQVLGDASQPNGIVQPSSYFHVPGREIVDPSDGRVIAPIPNDTVDAPSKALLTFTTCHPKFTAAQRMIIHAMLVPKMTVNKDPNKPATAKPPTLEALYGEVKL